MPGNFDIQPKRHQSAPTRHAPPKREHIPVRRSVPTRREAVRREPVHAAPRTPLKKKRQASRRKLLLLIGVTILVVLVLIEVVAWQPFLRVQTVRAEGPNASEIETLVKNDLTGTQYLILPKDSIFFLPIQKLRAHILEVYPQVEALSLAPEGLTTLHVKSIGRIVAFWWCGTSFFTPQGTCYQTDAAGLIFAPVVLDATAASTSMLWVYAPLASSSPEATTSVLGNSIRSSDALPGILSFVKALRSLNADVSSVDIRSDEADVYTSAGTRVTYLIGHEQDAANLAASSFGTLNLNDGSYDYIDLRFGGKVFFKKHGEKTGTSTPTR